MELTIAAQEMVTALGEISTFDDLATVIATAEEIATEQRLSRIATMHVVAAMAELIASADPVAPDYIVTQKQRDSPRDREYHHCPAPTDADTMENYLREAKHSIEHAQVAEGEAAAAVNAQLAIACAQVAQAELLEALIERLDALTEFEGGKALFVTVTE